MLSLNIKEKEGCRTILEVLDNYDLFSLNNTITHNNIAVASRDEAITVIIRYTERADDLLRRRKVTRDGLFRYLASVGVAVSPSTDKPRLVTRILQYWGSDGTIAKPNWHERDNGPATRPPPPPSAAPARPPAPDNIQWDLARAFLTWYFHILNHQNPDMRRNGAPSEEFGPQHFYQNAKVLVRTFAANDVRSVETNGASDSCEALRKYATKNRLLFSANVNECDVETKTESHGLVMIVCCGTLHRAGLWVGLFEQATFLIRDPVVANNWKIKEIRLNMRQNDETTKALSPPFRSPALSSLTL